MPQPAKLTYDDLEQFPEDHIRRELIDGVLLVSPGPNTRHQIVVVAILAALYRYGETHGGQALTARYDVKLDDHNVLEPDVLFVRDASRLGEKYLGEPPDLAVEVSSPSTKGIDRIRKRAVYERFGVAEYWIVDLDHDVIEAFVLNDGRYGEPVVFRPDDLVNSAVLPGFAAPFDRLVPPA